MRRREFLGLIGDGIAAAAVGSMAGCEEKRGRFRREGEDKGKYRGVEMARMDKELREVNDFFRAKRECLATYIYDSPYGRLGLSPEEVANAEKVDPGNLKDYETRRGVVTEETLRLLEEEVLKKGGGIGERLCKGDMESGGGFQFELLYSVSVKKESSYLKLLVKLARRSQEFRGYLQRSSDSLKERIVRRRKQLIENDEAVSGEAAKQYSREGWKVGEVEENERSKKLIQDEINNLQAVIGLIGEILQGSRRSGL